MEATMRAKHYRCPDGVSVKIIRVGDMVKVHCGDSHLPIQYWLIGVAGYTPELCFKEAHEYVTRNLGGMHICDIE
jgi:hypothetical protein